MDAPGAAPATPATPVTPGTPAYASSAEAYRDIFESFHAFRRRAAERVMGEIEVAVREGRFTVRAESSERGSPMVEVSGIRASGAEVALLSSLPDRPVLFYEREDGSMDAVLEAWRETRLRALAVASLAPVRAGVLAACAAKARSGLCEDLSAQDRRRHSCLSFAEEPQALMNGHGETRGTAAAAAEGMIPPSFRAPPSMLRFRIPVEDLEAAGVSKEMCHRLAIELAFAEDSSLRYVSAVSRSEGGGIRLQFERPC